VIEIISSQKSKKAIVTFAIGGTFESHWRDYSLPSLQEYCRHHNLGLYLQNVSLDQQKIKKKITWQKLLLPTELKKHFKYIEEFCYIDTDVLVNKDAPSVFTFASGALSLVSQFRDLPFNLNLVKRRIAFYRHNYLSQEYPLDSSLFMTTKQIYEFHNLEPQLDYACAGFFMGNIEEHSDRLSDIYFKYPAEISTLSDGGDEPILNYEFQKQFKITWLPYQFQALWLYEMAAFYPFLYQEIENQELILKCVETSLHNNIFLHFAGGWNESSMISVAKKIPLRNQIYTDFYNYLKTPVTGKPVGRILPHH
jgi:hypothetical protein